MCAELTPTGGKPASNMELLIYKVFKDLLVECETSNLAGGSQSIFGIMAQNTHSNPASQILKQRRHSI